MMNKFVAITFYFAFCSFKYTYTSKLFIIV